MSGTCELGTRAFEAREMEASALSAYGVCTCQATVALSTAGLGRLVSFDALDSSIYPELPQVDQLSAALLPHRSAVSCPLVALHRVVSHVDYATREACQVVPFGVYARGSFPRGARAASAHE